MLNSSNQGANQLSLSRFAFNIYGALNHTQSLEGNSTASSTPSMISKSNHNPGSLPFYNKLVYNCEREISCVSQFNHSLNSVVKNYEEDPLHHLIIGGKNYLKLLALSGDQSQVVHEINVLDESKSMYLNSKVSSSNKLINVNTIESQSDTIACELSTGLISIYKVQNNGKCKLVRKYSDHKRSINSLDFINQGVVSSNFAPNQLISGSQDGTIKLWDLRSNSSKPTITISSGSHSDPVRCCQYSGHASARNKITILSVHDSGALCKHDLRLPKSGQHQISIPERKWNLHTGPALSLSIHPEKEYVLTGGRDQKLCIWNYGDLPTYLNKMAPDFMINTYGPVMKVRWSLYPDNILTGKIDNQIDQYYLQQESRKHDDKSTYHEREASSTPLANNNSLYNYDFACLFLNEDPTITVYNLKRKYIPKEIITSSSDKPFQSFLWAKNASNSRRIWTITKSNLFSAYDLDLARYDDNITKPLENLTNMSMSWNNGIGDLCFVNQDKDDFEVVPQLENMIRSENEEFDIDSAIALDASGLAIQTNMSLLEEQPADERGIKYRKSSTSLDNSSLYNSHHSKFTAGSIPIATNQSQTPLSNNSTSLSHSFTPPVEHSLKPLLFRAATLNPMMQPPKPVSTIPQNRNSMGIDTLMEHPSSVNYLRPQLNRNPSQSTQGSSISLNSSIPPHQALQQSVARRIISVNHPSPYLIPISLPVTLNDESVFEFLSSNYLISLEDEYNLIDTCLFNANIAAGVGRFRDCQIWRILAVSLEEVESSLFSQCDKFSPAATKTRTAFQYNEADNVKHEQIDHTIQTNRANDDRSIISELDNFVGSSNSNSTMSTNYRGMTEQDPADNNQKQYVVEKTPNQEIDKESDNLETTICSTNSIGPTVSRSNNAFQRDRNKRNFTSQNKDDSNLIVGGLIDSLHNYGKGSFSRNNNSSTLFKDLSVYTTKIDGEDSKDTLIKVESLTKKMEKLDNEDASNRLRHTDPIANTSRGNSHKQGQPIDYRSHGKNWNSSFNYKHANSWDLDNENLNVLSNTAHAAANSLSSFGIALYTQHGNSPTYSDQNESYKSNFSSPRPYYHSNTPGSNPSRRNSFIDPVHGFYNSNKSTHANKQSPIQRWNKEASELRDVQEQTEDQYSTDDVFKSTSVPGKSELTKAIAESDNNSEDLSECKPWNITNLLKEVLDYAVLQGDVLLCSTLTILFYDYINHRKMPRIIKKEQALDCVSLYVEMLRRKQLFTNAINVINKVPKELLPDLTKLTNNEVNLRFYCCWCQKLLINEKSKRKTSNVGYWYCDECSKKQLNCVYCNEPCKGLNIVTSLRCGHRGHFGCLREWFINDENIECPGGCNELII